MTWPSSEGHRVRYGATTQARREALIGLKGDSARKAAQASALRALDRNGPKKSARQGWSFEGFTEVDCFLETDKLVLLIEGKRTENLAESTAWYSGRNQLHRNLGLSGFPNAETLNLTMSYVDWGLIGHRVQTRKGPV